MKITNKSQEDKLLLYFHLRNTSLHTKDRGIVKKIVNLNIAVIFILAAGINQ